MATVYVDSNAGGAADGTSWTDAFLTLAAALSDAGTTAGSRVWVAENHAETQASIMTLTSKGTAASPIEILCGDSAAEPPTALATTGTITTTGSPNYINFDGGFNYIYGLTFTSGGDVRFHHTTNPWAHKFEDCVLSTATTFFLYTGGVFPDASLLHLKQTRS